MNKEHFVKQKNDLIELIMYCLGQSDIKGEDKSSLKKLNELINQYTFENRLQKKGLLTHTIIDSLELDYSIGEKFIIFDENIK